LNTEVVFGWLSLLADSMHQPALFFQSVLKAVYSGLIRQLTDGQIQQLVQSAETAVQVLDQGLCHLDTQHNSEVLLTNLFYESGLYTCLIKLLTSGSSPDYLTCLNLLFQKIRSQTVTLHKELSLIFSIISLQVDSSPSDPYFILNNHKTSDDFALKSEGSSSRDAFKQVLVWFFDRDVFPVLLQVDTLVL
jgi:hypothetical protein